jgi:hypothetical protein
MHETMREEEGQGGGFEGNERCSGITATNPAMLLPSVFCRRNRKAARYFAKPLMRRDGVLFQGPKWEARVAVPCHRYMYLYLLRAACIEHSTCDVENSSLSIQSVSIF